VFRGATIGCYTCHQGPSEGDQNTSTPPSVGNASATIANNTTALLTLPRTNATAAMLRIVSQPANGSVGLNTNTGVATYYPDPGFVGTNTFTFAAYDGSKNSNLGTGTVEVVQGTFSVSAKALVPPTYPAEWAAPFTVVATPVNVNATPTYDWDFGDGSSHNTNQYPTHAFGTPGSYHWSVISKVQSGITQATTTNSGTIVIEAPAQLVAAPAPGGGVEFYWPQTSGDVLLEESPLLGGGADWKVTTNNVVNNGGVITVTVPNSGMGFFRLRKL
jgi:PKD repeat protein